MHLEVEIPEFLGDTRDLLLNALDIVELFAPTVPLVTNQESHLISRWVRKHRVRGQSRKHTFALHNSAQRRKHSAYSITVPNLIEQS